MEIIHQDLVDKVQQVMWAGGLAHQESQSKTLVRNKCSHSFLDDDLLENIW